MNRETKDYQLYISGAIRLGIGFGIVSLLARWVTGNTILSSPETLIKYGLTGAVGYSFIGALAIILFGFLAKKIRRTYPDQQTIGDVLRQKLNPFGYWCMMFVLLMTSLHSLFVQAMGAGILIYMIFPIPVFLGMFVFMLFCFLIGGIGGMQRIHQLAGINVSFIFAAVIVIPVYFFIQEGIYPVYDGIKLYHPYVLYIKNTDAVWFISTAVLIFSGQVMIDRATWQRVFIIKPEKIRMTFTLTGVVWATIPLAITSLIMIIMFGRGYENIYSLLFELVDKIQSTMMIVLFVLFCFIVISSAFSAELHAFTTLFVKNVVQAFRILNNGDKWRYTYISSGGICIFFLIIVSIFTPSPLELIFFFGNIYAAMIGPMLYIIFSNKVLPSIIPFSSIIGAVAGYLLLPVMEDLKAVWVSFTISAFICLCVFITRSLTKKYN